MENEKNESIKATEHDLQEITSDSEGYTVDTSVTKGDWTDSEPTEPEAHDAAVSNIDLSRFKNRVKAFLTRAIADRLVYARVDGGYTVIGFKPQSTDAAGSVDLVIPDKIRDLPVVAINGEAFQGNEYLRSVIIPDSVSSIGRLAFADCKHLSEILIPRGVRAMGWRAFHGCVSLESVIIENGITAIGSSAFEDCTRLSSVTIPYSVKEIGADAFKNCTSLASAIIDDGVTHIGWQAFFGCISLESVTIGSGVTFVNYEAFKNCTRLRAVHINDVASWCNIDFYSLESNPLYYAKNLYIGGEPAGDLVIPEGTECIKENAFGNCQSLTSVSIPTSMTRIDPYAFYYCENLTSVTISYGVKDFSKAAFSHCKKLRTVYFRGKPAGWVCDYLKHRISGIIVYYSENAPTTQGRFWHYVDGVPTAW